MPGLKYHHLGMPTREPHAGERYLPHLKVHVCSFDSNPYGVEWMRFAPDCALPELVQTVPHLAFEVEDLASALAGRQVIIAPNSPASGVLVAFIVHDGLPIEFLQFTR